MSESPRVLSLPLADNGAPVVPFMVGMTTRVAFGSLWAVSGQLVTLAASVVATPFLIRLLGTEAYGVWALIAVLSGYLGIADLGMSIASTKFASEAHAHHDDEGEAAAIWTSLLTAAAPVCFCALALALFASPLVTTVFQLPSHLQPQAALAMRLAAVGLMASAIGGVMNTAQLARLRFDLYTPITTIAGVCQIGLAPIVIALGGGLAGAVGVATCVALMTAAVHTAVSSRLLPSLRRPRLQSELIPRLLRFGGATTVMAFAGTAIMHGEKLLLVRLVSVKTLAYYSIAFTVARLLALAPGALGQSLGPAFARLHATGDLASLQSLFARAVRGLLLWSTPAALLICIVAKPLLTRWAGPEFGRESLLPLYVLAFGCWIDGMSYVPRIHLSAVGRPELVARYQAAVALPYLVGAAAMIYWFGAVGAATAWMLRALFECALMFRTVARVFHFRCAFLPSDRVGYGAALAGLVIALLLAVFTQPSTQALAGLMMASTITYGLVTWTRVLTIEERAWMIGVIRWPHFGPGPAARRR